MIALIALLLVGCGDPSMQNKAGNVQEQRTILEQRPTMQQITDKYTEMQQRIRQQLSTEIGPYGATIEFGTAANTVLGVSTGCHLTTPEPPSAP